MVWKPMIIPTRFGPVDRQAQLPLPYMQGLPGYEQPHPYKAAVTSKKRPISAMHRQGTNNPPHQSSMGRHRPQSAYPVLQQQGSSSQNVGDIPINFRIDNATDIVAQSRSHMYSNGYRKLAAEPNHLYVSNRNPQPQRPASGAIRAKSSSPNQAQSSFSSSYIRPVSSAGERVCVHPDSNNNSINNNENQNEDNNNNNNDNDNDNSSYCGKPGCSPVKHTQRRVMSAHRFSRPAVDAARSSSSSSSSSTAQSVRARPISAAVTRTMRSQPVQNSVKQQQPPPPPPLQQQQHQQQQQQALQYLQQRSISSPFTSSSTFNSVVLPSSQRNPWQQAMDPLEDDVLTDHTAFPMEDLRFALRTNMIPTTTTSSSSSRYARFDAATAVDTSSSISERDPLPSAYFSQDHTHYHANPLHQSIAAQTVDGTQQGPASAAGLGVHWDIAEEDGDEGRTGIVGGGDDSKNKGKSNNVISAGKTKEEEAKEKEQEFNEFFKSLLDRFHQNRDEKEKSARELHAKRQQAFDAAQREEQERIAALRRKRIQTDREEAEQVKAMLARTQLQQEAQRMEEKKSLVEKKKFLVEMAALRSERVAADMRAEGVHYMPPLLINRLQQERKHADLDRLKHYKAGTEGGEELQERYALLVKLDHIESILERTMDTVAKLDQEGRYLDLQQQLFTGSMVTSTVTSKQVPPQATHPPWPLVYDAQTGTGGSWKTKRREQGREQGGLVAAAAEGKEEDGEDTKEHDVSETLSGNLHPREMSNYDRLVLQQTYLQYQKQVDRLREVITPAAHELQIGFPVAAIDAKLCSAKMDAILGRAEPTDLNFLKLLQEMRARAAKEKLLEEEKNAKDLLQVQDQWLHYRLLMGGGGVAGWGSPKQVRSGLSLNENNLQGKRTPTREEVLRRHIPRGEEEPQAPEEEKADEKGAATERNVTVVSGVQEGSKIQTAADVESSRSNDKGRKERKEEEEAGKCDETGMGDSAQVNKSQEGEGNSSEQKGDKTGGNDDTPTGEKSAKEAKEAESDATPVDRAALLAKLKAKKGKKGATEEESNNNEEKTNEAAEEKAKVESDTAPVDRAALLAKLKAKKGKKGATDEVVEEERKEGDEEMKSEEKKNVKKKTLKSKKGDGERAEVEKTTEADDKKNAKKKTLKSEKGDGEGAEVEKATAADENAATTMEKKKSSKAASTKKSKKGDDKEVETEGDGEGTSSSKLKKSKTKASAAGGKKEKEAKEIDASTVAIGIEIRNMPAPVREQAASGGEPRVAMYELDENKKWEYLSQTEKAKAGNVDPLFKTALQVKLLGKGKDAARHLRFDLFYDKPANIVGRVAISFADLQYEQEAPVSFAILNTEHAQILNKAGDFCSITLSITYKPLKH